MITELLYDQILMTLGPAFWRKFRIQFWGSLREKYLLSEIHLTYAETIISYLMEKKNSFSVTTVSKSINYD